MDEARENARWNERSWSIWLIAERERAHIVAQQGRKFPAVSRDRVSELLDAVQERACAPRGDDGRFPAGAYKHADLDLVPGFLSEALFNALREHKRRRFDRTVADGEAVLAVLSDGPGDLADVVHNRHALDVIAGQASGLTDEVKAYMWADSAGIKRAKILADSGWTTKKLRAVRRELDEFRSRARVAVAALLPFPLLQRLLKLQGAGRTASAAGGLGAGAKVLLACGAAVTTAVCGVGAVLLADAPEAARPARPLVPAASPTPVAGVGAETTATPSAARKRSRERSAAAPARTPRARRIAQTAPARPVARVSTARVRVPDPPAIRPATSADFQNEFAP